MKPAQVSAPELVISCVSERHEHESAVLAAAREERTARRELEALGARQPGWTDVEETAHRVRLERWLAASRRLATALNRLKHDTGPQVHVRRV